MDERIEQSLDKILHWAEGAEGFVLEQAPLVAQEIAAWQFWSCTITAVTLFALCAAMGIASRVLFLWHKEHMENGGASYEDGRLVLSFILGFGSLLPLIPAFISLQFAIQAVVAPRLVILDYLKGIL